MKDIILSQALRISLPATIGFLVQLIKGTSLAALVGFTELSRAGHHGLGKYLGAPVEFVPLELANRIPALTAGRVDVLFATMAMFPDRAKAVQSLCRISCGWTATPRRFRPWSRGKRRPSAATRSTSIV